MGIGLLAVANAGYAEPSAIKQEAAAVEYVKICSLYGPDYFYMPGSDVCLNASSGRTVVDTEDGPLVSQSDLSLRIALLEMQIGQLQQQLEQAGLISQLPTPQPDGK